MQIFAFIVLIVVILSLTHVYNWVVRRIFNDNPDGAVPLFLTVTFFYGIAMYWAFRYLIIWGHPLL